MERTEGHNRHIPHEEQRGRGGAGRREKLAADSRFPIRAVLSGLGCKVSIPKRGGSKKFY